jgi:hypothetical protein
VAKADAVDFHMTVLDPPPPSDPSYPLYLITTTSFTVSFTDCIAGELPGGMTADGCYAGRNVSGQDWDNLQLAFMAGGVLTGQTANCAAAPSDNIFSDADCPDSPENGFYTLTFTDGVIGNGDYFFITEDGVTPATDFPTGSAQVLTPEPGSLVLLSTGILLFAWLLYGDRVRLLRTSLLS